MRTLLKVFNPFIAIWNLFKYQAHLETYRFSDPEDYVGYDFEKNDTKYF